MTKQNIIHPTQLVAHRGNRGQCPENTLLAFESALQCGAQFIEFDVQFTKDEVPMVIHDIDLQRIAGVNKNLMQLSAHELTPLSAYEPQRFGEKFLGEPISSLKDVIAQLNQWPHMHAFIEIKRATIKEFGVDCVMRKIIDVLQPVLDIISKRCTLISFNKDILQHKLATHFNGIGWVFDEWNGGVIDTAKTLKLDYLFVDVDCIPGEIEVLPNNSWQWVLYEISDVVLAKEWLAKGAAMIETDNICTVIQHEKL